MNNDFNNYNDYNNDENENNTNEFGVYNKDKANEYCFNPPKDKKQNKKPNKALKVLMALAGCSIVSVTSIVGYSIATGGNGKLIKAGSDVSQSTSESSSKKSETSSIPVEQNTAKRTDLPTISQLSTPSDAMTIPDIVDKVSPSVVGVSCLLNNGTATGTGIILSSDGYIVTNAHVISGAKAISVVLPENYYKDEQSDSSSNNKNDNSDEKYTYEATLIGSDTQTDIAVLKIEKTDLTPAEIGKSSDIVVGEAAIVIGNPLGFDLSGTVTSGIISATDRKLTIEEKTMNLIQTDASINSGNSGGPLINAYGQIIGITSAKVSSTYGEGLGFAIPVDEALPIIKDLMEYGYVTGRPTLGISGEDVTEIYAQFYNIPQGFIIRSVEDDSAAQKAGLKVGDVVIGINGELIESVSEFNDIKSKFSAGDTITVSVYRDGEISDKEVTLGEDRSAIESSSQVEQEQTQPQNPFEQYYNQFDFGN